MNFTSKHKGNIALAHALSYFGEKGYYLFLPVGDNGGAIDLAISEDGPNLQRVQCKYTARRHHSMKKRYPDRFVWEVGLQQTGRREKDGHIIAETAYDENSFDWLFVTTPGGDYLIEWKALCQELGRVPDILRLGKNAEKYCIRSVQIVESSPVDGRG
jgi:PD-(D/E)XK endonuclease